MTAHTDALRRRAASEFDGSPVQQERRPRVKSWIVFSMAVVMAFFGLILSRISLDKSAFDLEDLEQRIETEQVRQRELPRRSGQIASTGKDQRARRGDGPGLPRAVDSAGAG